MPIPRRSLGLLAGAAATRCDLGDGRTGATSTEAAVRLGEAVVRSGRLRLRGLQGYSGGSSHVRGIGGPAGDLFDAFAPALGALVTVVSTNHAGRATVDGGFKAFATDRPIGPVCRDLPGVANRFRGDEFGILSRADGPPPVRRGDRVELIPPHCDPTVNLYDRIHACRGDRVEAVCSVMDRLACGGTAGP